MSDARSPPAAGPSAFSTYASRFLTGKINRSDDDDAHSSQIFRPPSPTSSSHDPFSQSPTASRSEPHLHGASRSPSPTRTPPFPGPGVSGIPSIDDVDDDDGYGLGSGIGIGLMFNEPSGSSSKAGKPTGNVGSSQRSNRRATRKVKTSIPNPYAPSSDSDEDLEADLDEVATVRRTLVKNPKNQQPPPSDRAKKGWLAHQSVYPTSSSSSDTESDKATEPDSETDERSRMMGVSRYQKRHNRRSQHQQAMSPESDAGLYDDAVAPPPYANQSALDEPLLGPDALERRGATASVPLRLHVYHGRFGHWQREGLRKYKDSGFLALWLSSLIAVLVGLLFVWGSTDPPPDVPPRSVPSLVPLLPLLLVLLLPTLVIPPIFLFLLSKTVRPVLLGTAVSIPFSLFVCGWWALGASFEKLDPVAVDSGDQWWGTTGLRLSAAMLWLLAAFFARLVWLRRKRLDRTAAVVELSTHLLLSHPPLLLLTPLLLGVFAIASIPFLTLLVRLGTIGYWRHPRENTWVFHIRPYAGWLIFLVTLLWVWTWGVIRGVGRVAVAAVIGEWYFHRDDAAHPEPLEITTAALHRATGTSLGSVCLGAGIIAVVRTVGRSAAQLKRVVSPRSNILPSPLTFLSRLTPLFAVLAGILDQLNGYALVYVGITGEAFWPSARRAVGLAGKRKGGHLLDYTLIKLLLTLSSSAMGLFTGLAGYLYMSHALGNPGYAPVAAVLCGGVPFLAIRAGAAVLGDAADSLFICHQVDRELGGTHSEKANEAFAGEIPTSNRSVV